MIEIIFLIVGLFAVFFASITDLKKREVPDWLSYGLIVGGLGMRIITSVSLSEWSYLLWGLFGFGVFFLVSNVMYYTKQWGGGDSKLLMGIGAVFGNGLMIQGLSVPSGWSFPLVFLLNVLLVGAVYGIFFTMGLAVKNWRLLVKSLKKARKGVLKLSWIVFIFVSVLSFLLLRGWFGIVVAFGLFFLLLVHALFFVHLVERVSLEKWIDVASLTEGDWVLSEVKVGGKTLCKPSDIGLEKHQIELLKRYGVKKVLVKEGIPFVPSLFFALLVTLVWGNLLLYLF